MHLKRYRMPTVQLALARVRHELGPDALVLATRLVSKRGPAGWLGGKEVEITAAADRPSVSKNRPSRDLNRQPAREREDAIVARLRAAGLDVQLAHRVAERVPRHGRRAPSIATLRAALAQCLGGVAAGEEQLATVEVFVGPPGAGKTTTIAKIAAQERALHGTRLGLVAADGYRVGAVEQLRLYADIIGSPFAVARTPAEIESVVSRPRAHPVLVDTAGRSARDPEARKAFHLLAGRAGVRTHLVIPGVTTVSTLDRLLESFGDSRPDRVVLTRIDECDGIAPLFEALRGRDLAISYLGTGQRVPEDLERATPPVLAACLLGEHGAQAGDWA
jgi:flagellar biosynthesis protein FlhF